MLFLQTLHHHLDGFILLYLKLALLPLFMFSSQKSRLLSPFGFIMDWSQNIFLGVFWFFFSSENNHSLEQPLQELDRLLVIETFQDTIGLLDNLIQAVILMKVWSGWSLVLPSSLGCCMVLCFYESKFRGAGMGSDLGSTRFYVTAVLGLKPCFFVVSYSKSALNRA